MGFQSYNGIQSRVSNGHFGYALEGRNRITSLLLRAWTVILIAILFTVLFFLQNSKSMSQDEIPLTPPEFEAVDIEMGGTNDESSSQDHQIDFKYIPSDNPFQVSDSGGSYAGIFQPYRTDSTSSYSNLDDLTVGYLQYPHMHNNVSQGSFPSMSNIFVSI